MVQEKCVRILLSRILCCGERMKTEQGPEPLQCLAHHSHCRMNKKHGQMTRRLQKRANALVLHKRKKSHYVPLSLLLLTREVQGGKKSSFAGWVSKRRPPMVGIKATAKSKGDVAPSFMELTVLQGTASSKRMAGQSPPLSLDRPMVAISKMENAASPTAWINLSGWETLISTR